MLHLLESFFVWRGEEISCTQEMHAIMKFWQGADFCSPWYALYSNLEHLEDRLKTLLHLFTSTSILTGRYLELEVLFPDGRTVELGAHLSSIFINLLTINKRNEL